MTQPPLPTPNRHVKHIAHKSGVLDVTDQIEVTIDYPISRGAVVDYKATALSLAAQLSDLQVKSAEAEKASRYNVNLLRQDLDGLNTIINNLNNLLANQRRHLAVTYTTIHRKWYWNLLPSAIRAALTL